MDIAKVTWIGDRERREFATIAARLASENNAHFLTWSESLECSRLSSIVVLAQSRPGEFEATSLNRLRDGNSNSKWIRLLGAWCSGAGRALQAQSGIASVDAHLITSDVVRRSSMLGTIKDIAERDVSTEVDVIEGNAGPLVAIYGRSASYSRVPTAATA